jgi:hypothetical protein
MAGMPGHEVETVQQPETVVEETATPAPITLTTAGHSGYLDPTGRFHIFALLHNRQEQDAVDVEVTITLLGEDREVMASYTTTPYATAFPAGGKVPLHWVIDDVEPDSYTVRASGISGVAPLSPIVVEASHGNEGDDDYYYVQGRVRNSGMETNENPRLIIVLLDRDERPVNIAEAGTTPDTLRPGSTATFQIRFDHYPEVVGHAVYVLP